MVVLRRERAAVGAGRGDGDEVTVRDVGGEVDVAHDDVAALAVLADDAGGHEVVRATAVRERRVVVSGVESGAGVVAHAAVDADVGTHEVVRGLHGLDRADPVERHAAGADDAAARLDRDARNGDTGVVAGRLDDARELLRHVRRLERGVAGQVGDAEPSAEVEFGQLDAVRSRDVELEGDEARRGLLEPVRFEDLRADVAVEAEQFELGVGEHPAHGVGDLTVREGETELLVLVGRRDELVGVGLDAELDAQHDGRAQVVLGGCHGDALDLLERVDDDAPHAVRERRVDLLEALVVAVHADGLTGHLGLTGDGEFAAGADVETQALLDDPARDVRREERLARVVDVGHRADVAERLRERLAVGAGAPAHVVLVDDVGGGAEAVGQFGGGNTGDADDAVIPAASRAWPDDLLEGAGRRVRYGTHVAVSCGVEIAAGRARRASR